MTKQGEDLYHYVNIPITHLSRKNCAGGIFFNEKTRVQIQDLNVLTLKSLNLLCKFFKGPARKMI